MFVTHIVEPKMETPLPQVVKVEEAKQTTTKKPKNKQKTICKGEL